MALEIILQTTRELPLSDCQLNKLSEELPRENSTKLNSPRNPKGSPSLRSCSIVRSTTYEERVDEYGCQEIHNNGYRKEQREAADFLKIPTSE